MRLVLRSVAQLLVMSAIVTTALYVPIGTILVLIASALFGVSLLGFITFGGLLDPREGLAAWWAILFVPALIYAAYVMPWAAKEP
jgi:hypothetical protein